MRVTLIVIVNRDTNLGMTAICITEELIMNIYVFASTILPILDVNNLLLHM